MISEKAATILVGLELLLAAIHADDPKRELLVRVGDLMRDARSLPLHDGPVGAAVSVDMSNGEAETTGDRIFARVTEVTVGTDGKPMLLCEFESDNRTRAPAVPLHDGIAAAERLPVHTKLLEDINTWAHAKGTNAAIRDVLQRAHRAIRKSAPLADPHISGEGQ